jgi:hypothetical protein
MKPHDPVAVGARRRFAGSGAWVVCLCAAVIGCSRSGVALPPEPQVETPVPRARVAAVPRVRFTDVTDCAGIRFRHVNGATGKKLLPETMGSGCAFLDFDNDGHQDLLLLNGCPWPGFEPAGLPAPTPALYRNKGDGTFEDVTRVAGLDIPLYALGVAVGDFDNDGYPDLYITAMGGGRLFHNCPREGGGRKFVDVTAKAGDLAKGPPWPPARGEAFLAWERPIAWPTSATFVDYDKDGRLDLFVCNYVEWSPRHDLTQGFTLLGVGPAYGPPRSFEGTHCQLFRNKGDGTFEDVTRAAGIEVYGELHRPVGKSLGVVACDVDGDGWPDLIVANDTVRNFFFHNQRNGTFRERGQEAGIAYAEGSARGAMGIDWGEYRPGQCALLIGNFANEPDTFFRLDDAHQLFFSDVAAAEGVAGPSRIVLKFGVLFFDYDLDGRLDFLTANGHLEPDIQSVQPDQTYRQPVQVYWNTGGRPAFELATASEIGPDLVRPVVGRGCAYADIDGNGTPDVVVTSNGGAARLYRNEGGTGHHWIRLDLRGDGRRCNSSAIGARVVLTAGGLTQRREVAATKGYLSCSELPVTFGLGTATKVDRVEIHWPARDVPPLVLTDLAIDRTHSIHMR